MSQTKVKSGLLNFPDQTDFIKLPSGTTAQRPSSPEKGYSRYNTTDNKLEFWNGTVWQQLPGVVAPIITSISYPGDDLAADPNGGQTITLTGTDFKVGATVTVDGTTPSVITFVSATEITFTAPAKTAGDYDVVVTNTDGGNATAVDGITYNGLPSWTTPAGNLGTFKENTTIPTITLVAAEPDSGLISYSITTGGLPTGLSLTGADIDGTTPSIVGETTYNFTVTATDDENQSTERAFNIVVYKLAPSFNTVLYTGNGGTQSVTGVGFEPDLVWIKNRDNSAAFHLLFDSIRGVGNALFSNDTSSTYVAPTSLTSFNSDGFTVGTETGSGGFGWNTSPQKHVAWCWKAGGAAVATGGTNLTNRFVSANPEAGFSIMTYTGSGTDGEIEHGLNQAPELWFYKNRSLSNKPWYTVTTAIDGSLYYGFLNTTEQFNSGAAQYVTDTVIAVNNDGNTLWVNGSGSNYVLYAFHSVAGFSKFGSYVGNGNVVGEIIDCGFEPAFVMIKASSLSASWVMLDNKRSTSNPRDNRLLADTSSAEDSGTPVNFLINGFQSTSTSGGSNTLNATYIYMAFANQF